MDICFALALSSAVLLRVPAPLTLSWQHSVEHFRIEEDYGVRGDALVLAEVRTQGVGAGIDVPRDARFEGGGGASLPRCQRCRMCSSRTRRTSLATRCAASRAANIWPAGR